MRAIKESPSAVNRNTNPREFGFDIFILGGVKRGGVIEHTQMDMKHIRLVVGLITHGRPTVVTKASIGPGR